MTLQELSMLLTASGTFLIGLSALLTVVINTLKTKKELSAKYVRRRKFKYHR